MQALVLAHALVLVPVHRGLVAVRVGERDCVMEVLMYELE